MNFQFEKEYYPIYKYSSPPIMPGIRKLYNAPEEHHRLVVDLDMIKKNYIPNDINKFVPINGIIYEGFQTNIYFLLKLFLFVIIIYILYYHFSNKNN